VSNRHPSVLSLSHPASTVSGKHPTDGEGLLYLFISVHHNPAASPAAPPGGRGLRLVVRYKPDRPVSGLTNRTARSYTGCLWLVGRMNNMFEKRIEKDGMECRPAFLGRLRSALADDAHITGRDSSGNRRWFHRVYEFPK